MSYGTGAGVAKQTQIAVDQVNQLLDDPQQRQQMVDHNYEVAKEFFSFEVLEAELRLMVERPMLSSSSAAAMPPHSTTARNTLSSRMSSSLSWPSSAFLTMVRVARSRAALKVS